MLIWTAWLRYRRLETVKARLYVSRAHPVFKGVEESVQ